ncbi:hypothetical protein DesLBE_0302 [Desulfitobacterium sp. LBE]|uniref:Uncharacterized protein n=3 Tax=Desulfitobacterium TaxID=36853 RepID=A0A098AZE5_DESHA|nr:MULTISPECIES: hypothetical protein [Desulfitobacterium]ACL21067.1 hypothetical protein Dhaf_3044 [Desulfitobacterium hafniense DCB-2]KTE93113.1 hypothetical protein AT727_15375 [Desulfitobacterium hafniense]MEA5021875.1 hypothetical protein [Desulfitobacterium hafniense]TWH56115.1 hypothetical protein DesLBE_0302 [Desulfitobacterium sp. LBE]CDX01958.1 Hypothetical protein DPCES_2071 [Desulfitobacterium hafniense]
MRWLGRILIIFILLMAAKGLFAPEQPQAYISAPRTQVLLEEIHWRSVQIQQAARDLPGSIEVMLRKIFSDGKPASEAKSV